MVDVPVPTRRGQAGGGDGGDRRGGRGPGHLAGQVLRRAVGVGAGGGELLRSVPLATLGLAGVTAIDCRAAAVTVSTVEPVMPPSVAVIVEVPVRHAGGQARRR